MKKENLSTKSTSPNLCNEYGMNSSISDKPLISRMNYGTIEDHKVEMKKTHFVERQGDWICMRCKNLNFSFRVICNRCKILKGESDLLYDEHLQNVYNIFQFNEMMLQKNFLLNSGKNLKLYYKFKFVFI